MIRRSVRRILYTPWPQRWLVDAVALAVATAVLPRIGEGLHVHTAQGFALALVAATAVLLAASWALIPPPAPTSGNKPGQPLDVATPTERIEV